MDMSISKKRPISQLEPFEKPCFVVVVGTIEINDFFKSVWYAINAQSFIVCTFHGMENFVQTFAKATHE
jgi:hypothetical protein